MIWRTFTENACLADHSDWYNRGVLHRDVSIGNILICPRVTDGQIKETSGHLIDLDHAKISRVFETPSGASSNLDDDDVDIVLRLAKKRGSIVDKRAATVSLAKISNLDQVVGYINDAVRALSDPPVAGKTYTCEDLSWHLEVSDSQAHNSILFRFLSVLENKTTYL